MRPRSLAILMLAASAGGHAAPAPDGATWYSITAENGDRLGYSSRQIVNGENGREAVETTEIEIQELADPTVRITTHVVTREDEAGRIASISQHVQTGRSWSRTEARIGPVSAELSRQTPSETRTSTIALPPGVRFDGGAGLLSGWNPARTARLEFENFNLDAAAIEHVVIEPAPGAAPDPEGGMLVLRKRYENGQLRALAKLLLDRNRRVLAITQPMFGTGVTTRVADRETATRPHAPFHVLPNAMVRSPFRISSSALAGHIRYRFTFADGLAFELPETGEQRASAGPEGTILDICAGCGPGLAHDPATLADALKANAWLQSDHPRLRALAAPVARLKVTDARKMELLSQKARPYLIRIDFTGHYSALDTLSRRAGDCTEAAVLLAALGRAAGIPTRVVNGLVYARYQYHGVGSVFMPHSWTLAWVDGSWRSFDMALDMFDATHIALAIGDGDARSIQAASQLASLLQWKDMTEVRSRPAT